MEWNDVFDLTLRVVYVGFNKMSYLFILYLVNFYFSINVTDVNLLK